MEEFDLKKMPKWAWAVAIVGGLLLFWRARTTTSSGSAKTTATSGANQVSTIGSVNTSTPQCPNYPLPTCGNNEVITYIQDGQGCPLPICQPVQGTQPPAGTTPAPAPAPVVPPAPAITCYVVRPGDTLSGIAAAFGTPGGWQTLVAWNSVANSCTNSGIGFPSLLYDPNTIHVGWQLRVL